jgi:hypothetical protein
MNPAYFAGFVDGEGCIGFGKTRKSIFPRVLVTNTNIEILQMLQQKYGGDIRKLSKQKSNWKTGFYWRVSWVRALEFLEDIRPYLILKARQADTIFAWNAIRLGQGRTTAKKRQEYLDSCEMLVERMHWLNKRGLNNSIDPIDLFLV